MWTTFTTDIKNLFHRCVYTFTTDIYSLLTWARGEGNQSASTRLNNPIRIVVNKLKLSALKVRAEIVEIQQRWIVIPAPQMCALQIYFSQNVCLQIYYWQTYIDLVHIYYWHAYLLFRAEIVEIQQRWVVVTANYRHIQFIDTYKSQTHTNHRHIQITDTYKP